MCNVFGSQLKFQFLTVRGLFRSRIGELVRTTLNSFTFGGGRSSSLQVRLVAVLTSGTRGGTSGCGEGVSGCP